MANNVSNLVKQRYTKEVQSLLEESLVCFTLANTTLLSNMPDGNTINYPRPNYNATAQYVKYTDVVSSDLDYDNETLVINRHPYVSFEFDLVDEQDVGYEVVQWETRRNAYLLKEEIDWDFFSEYVNADYNNGAAVTLSTSNVVATYGSAYAQLANNWVDTGRIGLVVDPFQLNMIGQGALGNTFNVADAAYKNGYTAWVFQNMKVFVSSNLTAIGALNISQAVTNNDTVTINGVVFTFKTALSTWPAVAWEVLIGADAVASRANLISAINGTAWAGTTYTDVGDKVRNNKLRGLSTAGTGTTVVLTSKRGYKPTSQTLTHADNKWWAITIHNIAMEQGAIHLVMRNEVMLKVEDIQKQLGKRFITHTRYGIKTFSEWAERMFDIRIVAQAAE